MDTNLKVADLGLLVVYTFPFLGFVDNHNNERVVATISPTTGIPETTRMSLHVVAEMLQTGTDIILCIMFVT